MENCPEITDKAISALALLLAPIPFVSEVEVRQKVALSNGQRADFITTLKIGREEVRLVCEVKKDLQPRLVFDAIRQVKDYCSCLSGEPSYPVVVSEYISPRSAEILGNQNVSYFDLAGNSRLCFENVYIEKMGEKLKRGESRRIKSLFGLKSSRMLRLILINSLRPWQVKELTAKTELSLGQVSNIRRALLDQQYAMESQQGGIQLTQPDALLSDWIKSYKKNILNKASGYYSLLDPEERLDAIKRAIAESIDQKSAIVLNGLSAARWQAPYAKSMSDNFYADKKGSEILKKYLMLEPVTVGPNVFIEEPKDLFVFEESVECAPGLKCTSIIQTYLDVYVMGEREQEAAEHIKSHLLRKIWGDYSKDAT